MSISLKPTHSHLLAAGLLLSLAYFPLSARADSFDHKEAKFASGTGNLIYLAVGTLAPLIEDGPHGEDHALRTADSVLTSTLITEGLKRVVREKRPDSSDRTSFPSGHATAAFAVATMESHYHRSQAWFWYGGASVIAASRVQLHRHYTHDIIAGAAVGFFTARFELSRSHGLLISPFVKSKRDGGTTGLTLGMNF